MGISNTLFLSQVLLIASSWPIVKTYYCLRQAVGDDLIFEVEVIDPEDEQRDV